SSADHEVSQLLESNEAWEFWQKNVLRNGKFSAFHAANGAEFTSANYLYDSSLYNRVASLAKRGKIEPMLANLSDLSGQQALAAKLKSLH
ncbi:hypothetical protein, partial [Pseudomonas sp. GW704-F3]|uniref:hypothetical protein n=1 Tax=Pseudomonas sp. GW704-F3 TaxID=2070574 RepID=UPI001304FC47